MWRDRSPQSPEAAAPTEAPATDPAVAYSGIPYGPYDLWASTAELKWGPGPFTVSLDNAFRPSSLVQRIQAVRQKRVRLVLAMTGGPSEVITDGKFDLGKWKARMDRLNTSAIKKAVSDGVADGTIVANKLMDEPENPKWGGVPTKFRCGPTAGRSAPPAARCSCGATTTPSCRRRPTSRPSGTSRPCSIRGLRGAAGGSEAGGIGCRMERAL